MQADFADAVSLSQCCVSEIGEPTSFEDAKGNEEWENTMREGISALKKNATWDLVPLPAGVKPISCKWVYKVKRRSDGSVERARLVARGFSQQYGIDYDETFSPVAKMTTVRVLISLATSQSWRLWQMDVKNAFIYYGVSLHRSPAFSLPCIHTTQMKLNIPSQAQSLRHHRMLPFPICGSHLRRSEGTAVGHIWVGWLSLTYPFLFPVLLHFYSKKGAFVIYRRRPFEIGLEFSLLYYMEGVQLDIVERAIEQAYAFFRFFIQFAKVLHNE
jgi:hypothetical protein